MTSSARDKAGANVTCEDRIRIGISSCLLGERVRYDGGHKLDRQITGVLGEHFEFVPYCPEIAIGLGVPRATIRLQSTADGTRAVQKGEVSRDITDELSSYARVVAAEAGSLSGYIFKSRSPSCGMERVKVYDSNNMPFGAAPGIYAGTLKLALPLLPTEEEGRLNDPDLRDNFIERVLIYRAWQLANASGLTAAALVAFHAENKFLVMAHDQAEMRELGRMIADLRGRVQEVGQAYFERLMRVLSRPARRGNQVNVLQHVAGFLSASLDRGDRSELDASIHRYRRGEIPIIVPLTLIRHHMRRRPHTYLEQQRWLEERPPALDTRRG